MHARYFSSTTATQRRLARLFVGSTVKDMERELVLRTLESTRGNRSVAAHMLGFSVRTMRNKISEYTAEGVAVPKPCQSCQ